MSLDIFLIGLCVVVLFILLGGVLVITPDSKPRNLTENKNAVRVKGRNNGQKCNVCSSDCGQCG